MTAFSRMGRAALSLASEYGLAVFPIAPRQKKPPLTPNGFHDASSHPEPVGEWWDRWPDATIGAVPASIQCAVVDIDGPQGEELARSLRVLDTPTCATVTERGAHYWFRLSAGLVVGNLARSQLDVRSAAGYVVVPPSIHPMGGAYTWRGSLDSIADAPAALLAWLSDVPKIPEPAANVAHALPRSPLTEFDDRTERRVLRYAEKLGYGLSDGRKTAAFRFSAFLAHDLGLTESVASAFLSTWNTFNAPPLSVRLLGGIQANARRYGGRAGAA